MKIGTITDNGGNTRNVILGLNAGDILIAKTTQTSKGDIGASGLVYGYEAFIAGNEYKVHHTTMWDFTRIGYVKDEDGTLHFADADHFELKE